MRIGAGSFEVEILVDRFFALDGGAMFGIVPRTLWSRQHAPDAEGRVRLAARCLLARDGEGRVVLVDAGMGERWAGRARQSYGFDDSPGLLALLEERGLSRDDVTDVVVTHLHFDHAGGLVRGGAGRGLEPAFPRARVHVQAEHLAWAERPSPRDSASFRAADFAPLREAGLLELHEGPGEVLPGLEVRISHGHTRAMQVPVFRGEESTVVFPSDLVPTASHVLLPWAMAYDNEPLATAAEKAALLEEAGDGGWIVVPDHDPTLEAFRVERGKARFEVLPVAGT